MADWEAVSRGMSRGFERGVATGGKLSGLGQIIGKVADRLRSQRELGEQLNLLGQTERIKSQYEPWKPKTKEEALEFEREKYGIMQPIVDTEGNIIGYRPKGAVFQPQANQLETIISALGTETSPENVSEPKPVGRFNPLRALPQFAYTGEKKSLLKQPVASSNQENLITQYMQKYPNRTREEIMNTMRKQGLL